MGVYVREAHPTDGWRMSSNDKDGVTFAQPVTKKEREEIAAKCCEKMKMSVRLLVDEMDDRVGHAYSGMPDRLYLIDRDGRVAYKSGPGPFGFNPEELESAIRKNDPDALQFETEDTLKRVSRLGDLFEPVLKLKQRLPKSL